MNFNVVLVLIVRNMRIGSSKCSCPYCAQHANMK